MTTRRNFFFYAIIFSQVFFSTYIHAESNPYMVKDISYGSTDTNFIGGYITSNFFYFLKDSSLWRSDGTNKGTITIAEFPLGDTIAIDVSAKNFLYFTRRYYSSNRVYECYTYYRTNGYAATQLPILGNYEPVMQSGYEYMQDAYQEYSSKLVGNLLLSTNGWKFGLYAQDLSQINTKSIISKFYAADIQDSASTNDAIIFSGSLSFGSNQEPWRSDGTVGGTYMLKDIWPTNSSKPNSFYSVGNTVFFVADHPYDGFGLWKTNGTTAGTSKIINFDVLENDILQGEEYDRDLNFKGMKGGYINSTLYFIAVDDATKERDFIGDHSNLYMTKGTLSTTRKIKTPWEGEEYFVKVFQVGNELFYWTRTDVSLYTDMLHNTLWRVRQDNTGKEVISLFHRESIPYSLDYRYEEFTNCEITDIYYVNGAYYLLINGNLWMKRTPESTAELIFNAGVYDVYDSKLIKKPLFLKYVNGKFFFRGKRNPYGEELWAYVPPIYKDIKISLPFLFLLLEK